MTHKQRKAHGRATLARWYVKYLIIRKGFLPNDISDKDVEEYRQQLIRKRDAKKIQRNICRPTLENKSWQVIKRL